MKKYITLSLIGWLIATLGGTKAVAQETPPPPPALSEIPAPPPPPAAPGTSQEIIIRKKGDKNKKMTIEITDGKVLIDGKSIAEFKDDEITINNRKMIIRDGNKLRMDLDGKRIELDGMRMDINGKRLDLNEKLIELNALKGYDFDFDFDDNNAWGQASDYTYMGVTTEKTENGVKITGVNDDSPASKAGLKEGDVIYKIADKDITTTAGLSEVIRAGKSGDKVKVYYKREGKKKDVTVTLAEKKSSAMVFGYKTPKGQNKTWVVPDMKGQARTYVTPGEGMNFGWNEDRPMIVRGRPRLGLRIQDTEEGTGVKVIGVDENTPAATAGLLKDDVITEIGGNKVTNTDEAREKLNANSDKSNYTIKAKRNGNEMTFTVKIPKNLKTANL